MASDDYGLVLNAGSSSLKFGVFRRSSAERWHVATRGQIDGIGATPRLTAQDHTGAPIADDALAPGITDGRVALAALGDWLETRHAGSRLIAVGHRVVHGGRAHATPCIVTRAVLAELRALVPLAPLHQPHSLAAIDAVSERHPDVPQVACFDTSFHRGQAPVAQLVPLPQAIRDTGVQRYGFHGVSYEYIASVLPTVAPAVAEGRVIVAHLGNGASLCALRARKSVENTFGFTALDGLCMGTRPGALDPGVVLHLFQTMKLTAAEVENILYMRSGLVGISGLSNDMRALVGNPDPAARLAIDYFVHQAVKQIGALAAVLGGVDALVFTAGIGEHSAEIRRRICESSAWLGLQLDASANAAHGPRISTADSRVAAYVISTNEELMIARHTTSLLALTGRVEGE